jgi:hypothetical protein
VVIGLLLTWALEVIVMVAVIAVVFLKPRTVIAAPRAETALAEVGSFEVAAAPAAPA